MPGPGTYKIATSVGEGPKRTMGIRTSANSMWVKNDAPGPGAYVPKNVTFLSPKYTIKGKYKIGTALVVNSDGTHESVATNPDS